MVRSRAYFGRNMVVFCFWDPERGRGGGGRPPLDPPLISDMDSLIEKTSHQLTSRVISLTWMVTSIRLLDYNRSCNFDHRLKTLLKRFHQDYNNYAT